jgi:hypothetical protein
MIAIPKKNRRTAAEVFKRIQVVRAALMVLPDMPKNELAERLGISRGQLYHYLSGNLKCDVTLPKWSADFFHAAYFLAQSDHKSAADAFRKLAEQLDAKAEI